MEALEFSCIQYTRIQPATVDVLPVVANTRTIVEQDIKSKYPEKYSTVKVGRKKTFSE